jgi:hypothetical protein
VAVCDLPITAVDRVLVHERGTGSAVTRPGHQLPQARPGGRERVPGVPEESRPSRDGSPAFWSPTTWASLSHGSRPRQSRANTAPGVQVVRTVARSTWTPGAAPAPRSVGRRQTGWRAGGGRARHIRGRPSCTQERYGTLTTALHRATDQRIGGVGSRPAEYGPLMSSDSPPRCPECSQPMKFRGFVLCDRDGDRVCRGVWVARSATSGGSGRIVRRPHQNAALTRNCSVADCRRMRECPTA